VAEDITIDLTAEVYYVDDCGSTLGSAAVGDTITASYTYDTTTPDSGTAPTVGFYYHTTPGTPYGMTIEAGGNTFQTDASAPNFLVEPINNHGGGYPYDAFVLISYENEPVGEDLVNYLGLQLTDHDTATAIDSISLPTTAPDLDAWESDSLGLFIDTSCVVTPECPFADIPSLEFLCDVYFGPQITGDGYLRANITSAVNRCSDPDGDGVCDEDDNCPSDANADQTDSDADGAGDTCDVCPLDADDDADADGVCGDVDDCANTADGDVADDAGCSVADYCPCDADMDGDGWKNHGKYVSCVSNTNEDFVDAGLLTEDEADDIQSDAGSSDCGHKNK